MDTPCIYWEALEEPRAGLCTHQPPSLPGWSPGWQRYLAVLAAAPLGALGSLSQLTSGGIAAAVGALLEDREGLKHSRKPPFKDHFPSSWGGPSCHITKGQQHCSFHGLNHGAKPQHHPRCESLPLPLYSHYQHQIKGKEEIFFQKMGPDVSHCSLVAPFAHLQEVENRRISVLSASGEHPFRSQSRPVTQGFIPETPPGCLSQISP